MKYLILALGISLFSCAGLAGAPQCGEIFSVFHVQEVNNSPLSFRQAQLFRLGYSPSIYHTINLDFVRWKDLLEPTAQIESVIGLTREGQIYHVIKMPGYSGQGTQKIAALLSGKNEYANFLISPEGVLVGVRKGSGQVDLYSHITFHEMEKSKAWGPWGAIKVGMTTAGLALLTHLLAPELYQWSVGPDFFHVPLIGLAFLSTGLRSRFKENAEFENDQRTYTNGFTKTETSYYFSDLNSLQQSLWDMSLNNRIGPAVPKEQ